MKDIVRVKGILKDIHNSLFKPKPLSSLNPEFVTNKILNLLKSGQLRDAVNLLFNSPIRFPSYLYVHLFHLCSSKHAIVEARKVESHLISFYTTPPVFLLNRSIETFGKCGNLDDARGLFDEMPERDGGSWNAIITAYSSNGKSELALGLFREMNRVRVLGNEITFASVLGCCGAVLGIWLAREVHAMVVKFGFGSNVVLGSSLVNVYGRCGIMRDARRMFDEICRPNDVSWNVIVRRYLDVGEEEEAVRMFFRVVGTGIKLLKFTFSNALIACSNISALNEGKQIHGTVVKVGLSEDGVVANSLIDMYAKCETLGDARRVFDQPGSKDVISWTSIVSGYATCGRIEEARELFNKMPSRSVVSWNAMLVGYTRLLQWEEALKFIFLMRRETIDIDNVTLSLILKVCAGLSDVVLGKQVHGFAYRHGFYSNVLVANAILDVYGKCGSLKSSKIWFFEMGRLRDSVSWNALISGYACHGFSEAAMEMFREMQRETTPTRFILSTLLAACANVFALEQGKQTHGYMLRNGYNMDVVTSGVLVDMYSKCRCLEYAIKVFKQSTSNDLILWNSMILGCAHNGEGGEVLDLFELMQKEGIKSDHVTFQGILLACIGDGFVDVGRQYFDSMSRDYCIIPRLEHYECMIELYSRYGYMNELEDFVHKMPFEPTEPMLYRIFDACREHGHSKLGEWTAQRLNEFKP